MYRITDDGRAAMAAGLGARVAAPDAETPPFTVALSLLSYLPNKQIGPALRQRCSRLESWLADLEQQAGPSCESPTRERLWKLHYQHTVCSAELAWVKSLLTEVEREEAGGVFLDPSSKAHGDDVIDFRSPVFTPDSGEPTVAELTPDNRN